MSEKNEADRPEDVSTSSPKIRSDQTSREADLEKDIRQYIEQEEIKERQRRDSPISLAMYPGTEPVEYNYTRERQNPHPANLVESTAHLVKCCMGAGMLGMHEAFMHGGIWTSLACTIIIGVLLAYIMLMLVRSAHKVYAQIRVSRLSYADLAEAAVATGPAKGLRRFNKVFRHTVDICLFIETCGTCCIFELIIARTLQQGLEGAIPELKARNYGIRLYILIITVPLILLCCIRSLKYLAAVALFASLFVTSIVGATTVYSITSVAALNNRPAWKSYPGFFRFLGTCIYSVQGVTITMPLENNMRSPHHFATVLQFGMSFVVLLFTAIGFLGYWDYGESCETPITIHLPLFTSTIVLQFILAIMMTATLVLHFWLEFRTIWYYVGKKHRRKRGTWESFYRAINVILISCISLAFPDASFMMSFLGAVICSWVCFIFPAFIDILVIWRDRWRSPLRWTFIIIRDISIMVFGGVICIGAIVSYIL